MPSAITMGGGGSGTGAPTDATYIVQTANASLSAEQAMGSLATGIVKNTTTTGVQSIAVLGRDYSLGCHIAESFDGLSTAAIHGQGVYNSAGAWVAALGGASTANVEVKSGSDKMLTLTAATGSGTSTVTSTLSNRWGFMGGGRISFKIRTNDVDKGAGGVRIKTAAAEYATMYIDTDGNIKFWQGTSATTLGVASDNTWYSLDMLITTGTTTARNALLFIDGAYINTVAAKAFAALVNTVEPFISADAAVTKTVNIDDLIVYNAMGLDA